MTFDTLLVANRGEIACRILRTARAMGLRTVAVYSAADRAARHVAMADTAVAIGGGAARDTYLSIERILHACAASGAQAVHPGYGFLAENASFARACLRAGLVFVGPSPEAIETLGNKVAAKQLAARSGVACLPGYGGDQQSPDVLAREAARLGAPLMIKAAAGGGGRGIRRVDDLADFAAACAAARGEAAAAFGSGDLLLERLVHLARHVEVQVLADRFGHCVHLGERDCSTQRRHQKIIEEAPAPGVTPALRASMGEAAVKLALAAGYVGAGTVEFLLDPEGGFHFLEVNTRLQVEHPVTEAVTGLDLVELQLRIARGEPLPFGQQAVRFEGHAIEARLCAEDAFDGFAPQSGPILAWRLPGSPRVRVDHELAPHAELSRHYDSMIAKLVAKGRDRDEARRRLVDALGRTSILGVGTNRDFLIACLQAPAFVESRLSTSWVDAAAVDWKPPTPGSRWQAVATALWADAQAQPHGALANWSSTGPRTMVASMASAGRTWQARITPAADGYRVAIDDSEHLVSIGGEDRIEVDGLTLRSQAHCARDPGGAVSGWLDLAGVCALFDDVSIRPPRRTARSAGGDVCATMHGQVASLAIATGDRVRAGQALLAIEAMKMQHRIDAPVDGRVIELGARVGAQVAPGTLLLRIAPDGGLA
ncbi:MAG: ATP-grasp domain-containing protein [Burkholderiales bacterium]|nr:MAG: ATP-grasp domain-containing protein [Burkholderiales bacterium]